MDLQSYWKESTERINQHLENFLHLQQSKTPKILYDAMHYSLIAPGKRVRPLLVFLACESCNQPHELALPAAAAIEMVHSYSLVHDDLPAMDDDDLRRGRPTNHKVFGEAIAILAGDALLTLSFEILSKSYHGPLASVLIDELASSSGMRGMVGGQVLDLQAEGRFDSESDVVSRDLTFLESIHRAKTGALFQACVRMGLAVGKNDSLSRLNAFEDYISAFGLCFQLTDDLLDVTSNAETTGKQVNKDADRGKLTYPSLIGLEASRQKSMDLHRKMVDAAERLASPVSSCLIDLANLLIHRRA
jgi:geranylgeranyl diphosphate synthase, type II